MDLKGFYAIFMVLVATERLRLFTSCHKINFLYKALPGTSVSELLGVCERVGGCATGMREKGRLEVVWTRE